MADIFISYAHEDRGRVEPLAHALETAGFSVWWDREIRTGEDFDEIIEAELDKAACVIVGWSGVSRKSRYVKGEAREAVERGVLTPVFLEQVKPPLDLRSLHTEDFSNWQGDQKADCWQRLILQAQALKDAVAEEPRSSEEMAGASTDQPNGSKAVSAAKAPGGFNAGAAFVTTTLPLMAAAWFFSSGPQLGVMGLTVTLALLGFLLFRQADRDLHPHMKALASRWLLPQEGRAGVNMPEAFLRLFEAVFGRKHWSWRCLWRTTIASTLGLLIMLVVFDYFETRASLLDFQGGTENLILAMFIFGLPINIYGDYLSLWETRKLLLLAARRPAMLPLLILLDAILTLAIWMVGLTLPVFVFSVLAGSTTAEMVVAFKFLLESSSQGLWDMSAGVASGPAGFAYQILFGAILATSFITSVWLWLAVMISPLVRAFLWSRTSGLSALGRFFNTEQKPFTALGFLTALLILFIGTAFWSLGFLIA